MNKIEEAHQQLNKAIDDAEDEAKKKVDSLLMKRYDFGLSQWLEYDIVDKAEEGYQVLTHKDLER